MPRSPFVRPAQVSLSLADVHKRAHDALIAGGKATPEDLAASAMAVHAAEADGYFIVVKKELTAGEQNNMFTSSVAEMFAGQRAKLDPVKAANAKVLEYLVGWSFCNDDGTLVPVSESALNNLNKDVYRDIAQAIDWHEEEQDKARAERKNDQDGESTSKPLSPSVVS